MYLSISTFEFMLLSINVSRWLAVNIVGFIPCFQKCLNLILNMLIEPTLHREQPITHITVHLNADP